MKVVVINCVLTDTTMIRRNWSGPWDGATSTTPFQPHPNAQWFNLRDMIRPQNDKPIHAVCRLNQFFWGWIGEMPLPSALFITLCYVHNRPCFRLCVDILKTDWSPAWTLQYLGHDSLQPTGWTPALQFDDVPAVDELTVSRLRMFKVATQLSCSRHIVSRNGTETRHRDHASWWNMNFSGHCITASNCMAFCRSTLCIFDRAYQQIVHTKLGWHLLQHTIDTMSWARYWKVRVFSFDGYQCGKVNNIYTAFIYIYI